MNQRFIKVRFNSYLRNYMNKKCVKYSFNAIDFLALNETLKKLYYVILC